MDSPPDRPADSAFAETPVTPGSTPSLPGTPAPWAAAAARKLDALGRLSPGWDSYGGLPLQPASRNLAASVLGWLGEYDLPEAGVSLGSAGTVQLEWRFGGRELEIEIVDRGRIEFVAVDSGGDIREEGEAAAGLPEKLADLARWLLRGTE